MSKGLDKEQWLIGSVHQCKARTNQQPTNQPEDAAGLEGSFAAQKPNMSALNHIH